MISILAILYATLQLEPATTAHGGPMHPRRRGAWSLLTMCLQTGAPPTHPPTSVVCTQPRTLPNPPSPHYTKQAQAPTKCNFLHYTQRAFLTHLKIITMATVNYVHKLQRCDPFNTKSYIFTQTCTSKQLQQ